MVTKTLFMCPNCLKPLGQGEKQYFCPNGHSFDISKKGYVNLLLPSHTGAGDPGDSKEMLLCRRDFLDKGYYERFSHTVNKMVLSAIHDNNQNQPKSVNILDAGCGEGYYIYKLKKFLSETFDQCELNIYGTDVSKPAIHYAAGRDKQIRFAVASSYHVPILDNSLDFILCIFAPRDEKEFRRILKPSGKLIVAAPGPKHLYSLRQVLYKDPEELGLKGTVEEGFALLEHQNISYEINLNSSQDIFNLFTMTPYSKHADTKTIEKLKEAGEFTTEVDFNIRVYEKI